MQERQVSVPHGENRYTKCLLNSRHSNLINMGITIQKKNIVGSGIHAVRRVCCMLGIGNSTPPLQSDAVAPLNRGALAKWARPVT